MSPASVTITQLEPVVYLRGQSASGEDARGRRRPVNVDAPPSQLRGLITVYLPKPCKVREITVSLTGTARTDWPEGIGPNRLELVEEATIFRHIVTLFDAKVEGSLPGRRRSNSVGPGIGLMDEVDWELAATAASGRSRASGPPPAIPREEERNGSNLARQLAEAAAKAGTAIIPPTLRPDLSLVKPKHAPAKAVRPALNRTGSGTTSWNKEGTAAGSAAAPGRSQLSGAEGSQGPVSPGRDRGEGLGQLLERHAGIAGSSREREATLSLPVADGPSFHGHGGSNQAPNPAQRWSYYLDPSSQDRPPGYMPRSAPLYGYDGWPSTTILDPPGDDLPSTSAGFPSRASEMRAADPESEAPQSAGQPPSNGSTAPPSPTLSRSPATTPSKSILNLQPQQLARAKDQTVRFDRSPAAPAALPASARAASPPAPGPQTPVPQASVGLARSTPASRRSSVDVGDREKTSNKPKQSSKTLSDYSKGKKSGLKGLIGGLLKEHDTKAEEDPGAASESKEFKKGTYTFPICISLPANLPPTLHADFGFNKYVLKAAVNRAGALTPNLAAEKEVKLILAPDEDALDETDSIVVERSWEDVLSYMVVLSGKSFPFGRRIPLWMKFVPQGKVRIHRITATLEERTDYFAKGRRVARHEVPRKWTLLKVANEGTDEPLLPITSDSPEALERSPLASLAQAAAGDDPDSDALPSIMDPHGPWELAAELDLPNHANTRINLSTNHAKSNIAVHHLVRISIRVEKPDGFAEGAAKDAQKHKLYDIIIEAPITLTSLHTADEWMNLPNYWSLTPDEVDPTDPPSAAVPADDASRRPLLSPPGVPRAIPRPVMPNLVVSGRLGPSLGISGPSSPSTPRSPPGRERESAVEASTPLRLSQRWLALSSSAGNQGPGAGPPGPDRENEAPTMATIGRRGGIGERTSLSARSRDREPPPPAYEPNARQGERVVASSRLAASPTEAQQASAEGSHQTLAAAH
ncbi:hypothetical protein ACQY0O_001852 [Thecaphora frezii]